MPEKENTVPASDRILKNKRQSSLSLPDTSKSIEQSKKPSLERRNTVSEENVRTKKRLKAPLTPTIPEDGLAEVDEKPPVFRVESERKKLDRKSSSASRISMTSSKSRTTKLSYDNKAFDNRNEEMAKNSKAPSIQSLEVYHEQYCCCSKRTKCERILLITVSVLIVIIIVLVIVIAVLADEHNTLKTVLGIN